MEVVLRGQALIITETDLKIVRMLADSHKNESIARSLGISRRTVESRQNKIRAVLGPKMTLCGLVAEFMRRKLIE